MATGHELSDEVSATRPAHASFSAPVFLAARGERLPFRDAAVEAILCRDVLHWVPGEAACRALWHEAWRVLKPGGLFHVRCVSPEGMDEASSPSSSAAGEASSPSSSVAVATGETASWFPVPRALIDALLADGAGIWASPPRREDDRLAFTARKPG